jgi:hypothetical protein
VALVRATRDGRTVRYELTDPEILAACDLMRNVLVRRLSALGSLAAAASVDPGHQARPAAARPTAARPAAARPAAARPAAARPAAARPAAARPAAARPAAGPPTVARTVEPASQRSHLSVEQP